MGHDRVYLCSLSCHGRDPQNDSAFDGLEPGVSPSAFDESTEIEVMPAIPPTLIPCADGVRVAVHDLGGPADANADILLFSHATGLHGRTWDPMAAQLTDRYRCFAIDHRGHGVSETPEDAGLAWSHMGDDTVAVLDSGLIAPHRVIHGVGHSMGGAALVLAAIRRPLRLRSLWLYEPVIVPPGVLPSSGEPNVMAAAAERRRATFDSVDAAAANYASKPPLDELHPAALQSYVMGGFAPQPDGTVRLRCLPATEASVFRGAGDSGAWIAFSALAMPVAVVGGRSELVGPRAFVPAILQSRPATTFIERPELGHFGPLEDPISMARDLSAWVGTNR
jgi:pimeloyl-ACP methyl ester carboxylesterase